MADNEELGQFLVHEIAHGLQVAIEDQKRRRGPKPWAILHTMDWVWFWSGVGEVVKIAGPMVVGVVGIVFTYLGSTRQSKNQLRHELRAEKRRVYAEYLHASDRFHITADPTEASRDLIRLTSIVILLLDDKGRAAFGELDEDFREIDKVQLIALLHDDLRRT